MEIVSIITTTIINAIALAAVSIIIIRIKEFQRKLKTDGLGSNYPYSAYMEIWVESAALIVSYYPNFGLFCSTRIIYLHGMFDRYKCTRP